ncbi:MAG: zinc-ribbon domain-containing protein [Pseudobutyrivibrio sp.]|nr:zinc-ribbon domain-containing protein [Pseudobutyrivibrio sp.]
MGANSLKNKHPEIAKEWNYALNEGITPDVVAPHSNKKFWWICEKGHSYETTPDKRVGRGQGCPYCAGKKVLTGFNDLATICPDLLSEWDYEKNIDITPTGITSGSKKKVWWKCQGCGCEWLTSVNDRKKGARGCPECAKKVRVKSYRATRLVNENNRLAEQYPALLEEWDYASNKDISPLDYSSNSDKKVWWVCSTCGNHWIASIKNRAIRGSGCPKCRKHVRTSFPEQAIFFYIRKYFYDAENSCRTIFDDYKKGRGMLELDVYIPSLKIGVEYDGVAWHKSDDQIVRGKQKYSLCHAKGIKLIRISEFEVDEDGYCDYLIHRLDNKEPSLNIAIKELLEILRVDYSKDDIDVEANRGTIMQQYIKVLHDKSIAVRHPEAIKEWDFEKNKNITPEMVNATSNKNYWWICEKGHSFKASPVNKFNSPANSCPYCTNHKVLSGFNDMITRYPYLENDWDYEKNKGVNPKMIMPGSAKKYWWKCSESHSYLMTANNKVFSQNKCPICSGKRVLAGCNDLESKYPDVIKFWDYEKNREIKPSELHFGSNKSVWWRCTEGHSFKKTVAHMVKFDSCPICTGRILETGTNDLKTKYPNIAAEWDYSKNGDKIPDNFKPSSREKIWWKCATCGNSWNSMILVRTSHNAGCPVCGYAVKQKQTNIEKNRLKGNTLAIKFPEVAKDWDYEKNGDLTPNDIAPHSNTRVWWKCSKGHSYFSLVDSRTGKRKTGCPYCSGKRKLNKPIQN